MLCGNADMVRFVQEGLLPLSLSTRVCAGAQSRRCGAASAAAPPLRAAGGPMAFLALFTGTLFWLVVFFCLMASAYVLFRDGFGFKGALEAAVFLGLMVVVGLPLHMAARPAERAGDGGLGGGGMPAMGSPRRRRDADDGVGAGGRAGVSAGVSTRSLGAFFRTGLPPLSSTPPWDASCPCCSPFAAGAGAGVPREVVFKGWP